MSCKYNRILNKINKLFINFILILLKTWCFYIYI